MDDNPQVNCKENAVKSILESEPVKNLANPPTKSVGNALGNLCDLVFGNWLHEKAEKSRLKHQKNIEDFKKKLLEDVDRIPEENLIQPKESVIGPALEASKYYYSEKEIREMFEKLIVNSMDNRKASKVHPSFTEIIKQMSPLDAQNLMIFDRKNDCPIAQYTEKFSEGGYNLIHTNVFYGNPNCYDTSLQAVSISSLNRIGLISISYNEHFTDDRIYNVFRTSPLYKELKNNIESTNQFRLKDHRVEIVKGIARITPLGKTFTDVCLSPLPN